MIHGITAHLLVNLSCLGIAFAQKRTIFDLIYSQISHKVSNKTNNKPGEFCWENYPQCPSAWLKINNVCYFSPQTIATTLNDSETIIQEEPILTWEGAMQYCSNLSYPKNGSILHYVTLLSLRSKSQSDFVLKHVMPQIKFTSRTSGTDLKYVYWIADVNPLSSLNYVADNLRLGRAVEISLNCPAILIDEENVMVTDIPCNYSNRFVCERSRGANYRCSNNGECATHLFTPDTNQFRCLCRPGYEGNGVLCVEEETFLQLRSSQIVLFSVFVFGVSMVSGCICWLFSINFFGYCPPETIPTQEHIIKTPHVGVSRWSQIDRPPQNEVTDSELKSSQSEQENDKLTARPTTMFDIQKPRAFESYGLPRVKNTNFP